MRKSTGIASLAIFTALAVTAAGRPPAALAQEAIPTATPMQQEFAPATATTPTVYGDWRDAVVPTYLSKGYVTGSAGITLSRWGKYNCAPMENKMYCLDGTDGVLYRAPNLFDSSTWTVALLAEQTNWVVALWEMLSILAYLAIGLMAALITIIAVVFIVYIIVNRSTTTVVEQGWYATHPTFKSTVQGWYNDPNLDFRRPMDQLGVTPIAQYHHILPGGFLP